MTTTFRYAAIALIILILGSVVFEVNAQTPTPSASTTPRSVAWNPDGIWIARAFQNGTIDVVNANTGATVFTYNNGQSPATALAWRPGAGSTKLVGAIAGSVFVWDVPTANMLFALPSSGAVTDSLDWTTQNGDKVVGASYEGASPNLRVWDASTGQLIFGKGIDQLGTASWNSTGTLVVVGAGLGVRTVSLATGQVQLLSANSFELSAVRSVAWSPDGTKIADSGIFGQVTFRNAANGQFIAYSEPTRELVNWIAWSNDSTRLASASWDGTVRVWNAANGALIDTIQPNNGRVFSVDWSPDNSKLVVGSENGAVQIFPAMNICPCSLFGSTVPSNPSNIGNPPAVNLGVVFKPSVNGQVTGIRFYKLAGNGGTHKGYLWSATGTQLGTVTFSGETATGWQTATFATPITVTANTVYVASYHAPQGRFAYDLNTFTSGRSVLPLYALATGETSPGNGTYIFGAAGLFPNATFTATNYWVDVVFSPT
ncbi:MAG: DUF4082 domain-containing protein [Chloroflexi bacterium]|nr:DUF4082 domain-containing protein [Chloroflexota bacterium]MCC6896145.1 DUF4082 domain-containing protein [Anaerolineae bacterium]